MFDTMTITKVGIGFCAALLVLMLGGWAASGLYNVDRHNDDYDHEHAYVINPPEEGAVEAEPEPEIPFAEVYAVADAGAGERLWRQCSACHALNPGQNGVGPYLHGVVNRAKGAAEGYDFSDVLASMGGEWTPENLSDFIANPRGYAPGTAMNYAGMDDIEDRANLIAYLETQQ